MATSSQQVENKISCSSCNKTYIISEKYLQRYKVFGIDITQSELKNICPHCLDDDWLQNHATNDQKYVFSELYKICLINNHDHYYYLLNGLAGTGKTTLIEKLLRRPEFAKLDVYVCAPTNKALDVLTSKLDMDPDNLQTQNNFNLWSFKTIFKLLKQKAGYNNNGEIDFKKRTSNIPTLINSSIVIVDEASMIDKEQFDKILMLKSISLKTAPVIIFIGDRCQLPPVKETTSCVFDYPKMVKYNLTEIVRSGEVLTNLSNSIRTLIEYDPLITRPDSNGYVNFVSKLGKTYFFGNKDKFIHQYVKCFRQSLEDNVTPPIILTYTNNECDNLNLLCRNSIFAGNKDIKSLNNKYLPSESIVFESLYSYGNYKFSTSEQVRIKAVNTSTFAIDELDWNKILEAFKNKIHLNDTLRDYIKEVNEMLGDWDVINDKISITGEKKLSDCLNKLKQSIINLLITSELPVWDLTIENGAIVKVPIYEDQYKNITDNIKKIIQSHLSDLMTIYQSQFLLNELIIYLFNNIWSDYYHRQCIKPIANITYGYAITTYKSQGSTYRDVFIGIPNIVNCEKVDPLVRMKSLYTAISRASHNVYIYNLSNYAFHIMKSKKFTCELCNKSFTDIEFYKTNYHIDKSCVNKILNTVTSGSIIEHDDKQYLITKNKYVCELNNVFQCDDMDIYNQSNIKKILNINK